MNEREKLRMTKIFGLSNQSSGATKTEREKTTGREAVSGISEIQFRTQ